jgi:signal transduction histidine kinase
MTVIVLQAGAARRVWDSDPGLAHEHAGVLRETLRDALDELRELILAIAQKPKQTPATLRIEGLVQRARASGMVIELAIDEQRRPAREEVERAAYRIVQEALTNAAKHAPGAAVRVRVDQRADNLSITVENGPPLRVPEAVSGSGLGLRGMRERTDACGGKISATGDRSGAFRIAASLPL